MSTRDSTAICPNCGHVVQPQPSTLDYLRGWCARSGKYVCADDAVFEDVAAEICGRSPGTLMNWRSQGIGPQPYRHGATGRVRYRLRDIAAWLDSHRVNDFQ
jgi:hypothetical protein